MMGNRFRDGQSNWKRQKYPADKYKCTTFVLFQTVAACVFDRECTQLIETKAFKRMCTVGVMTIKNVLITTFSHSVNESNKHLLLYTDSPN